MDVDFSSILSRVQLQPDKPETCPMAKAGERCRHGWHERDLSASPCPLGRYRSERVRLANELALCGYGPKQTEPIGPWLFERVNPARDAATLGAAGVANLRNVLARWKAIRLATADGPQHVSLIGGTGTAKTMLSLSLYFAWLHDGASCHWIEQGELIRQAESAAWPAHDLPRPVHGAWVRTFCGGWVTQVAQSTYGHRAIKMTWLYYVGKTAPPALDWSIGKHTARVSELQNRGGRTVERMGRRETLATPIRFRDLLLGMAIGSTGNGL